MCDKNLFLRKYTLGPQRGSHGCVFLVYMCITPQEYTSLIWGMVGDPSYLFYT
ncbi:hypothetical protein SGHV015 [Glossina pallidipes salivary gland hypertrophy virus]|uniref:Uncharacterized protein n=1 Tax=Glossina hytrovirus (isolate Glossina pallidipes/Ethiopia/Seibersdorf/-) TaxID=379529 RepID=B0YLG9_GHVS|nr:hypothetical protein SGHV015 [Glossina pallidipes salivary gland hypertrophy virus]ABQ08788.1 hypothetical protein SGHV015 [Glossina pallidipes salivary gland hypertrophy virus]